MASDSSIDNSSIATNSSNPTKNLITINTAAQLPLKLMSLNYFSWKAQLNALLFGLDFLGYLDNTFLYPFAIVVQNGKTVSNPDYLPWYRQDQLLLYAIFASLSEGVIPLVSSVETN